MRALSPLLLCAACCGACAPTVVSRPRLISPLLDEADGAVYSDIEIDHNHPKYFLRISELTDSQDTIPILQSFESTRVGLRSDTLTNGLPPRTVDEIVNAEIDVGSKILIEFDRNWMLNFGSHLDVALGIHGEVKGATEVRAIEIPGYSMIGKELETATARIRSAQSLVRLLGEVGRALPSLYGVSQKLAEAQTPDEARRVLADIRRELIAKKHVIDVVLARLADPTAEDVTEGIARVVGRDAQVLRELAKGAAARITAITLNDLSNDDKRDEAQRDLLAVETFLSAFTGVRLPEADFVGYYRTIIRDSSAAHARLATAHPDSLPEFYRNVRYAREQIREAASTQVALSRFFLSSLKDTDVLVSLTGAKPGEDVILTFTNQPDDKVRQRSLTMRLQVRRFGLVQRTTDALFLLKRRGVSSAAAGRRVDRARQLVVDSGGVQTVLTPERVQFAPAGGATFGWVYYARRSSLLRFLKPGAGVNVSFPRFADKTTTITATGAGQQPVVDAKLSDQIDIGTGLVFSLFDNAIQATYGVNLTSRAPRSYWGLGFSFVGIAEKLGIGDKAGGT